MGKNRDEAYELLEEMASNEFQWQAEKEMPKKLQACTDWTLTRGCKLNSHD